MDETDSSNPESNNKSDEWKSWTPKEFLATTLHELRTPIILIKDWIEILSNEETKELHPKAIEDISQAARRLEDVMDGMTDYLRELMKES